MIFETIQRLLVRLFGCEAEDLTPDTAFFELDQTDPLPALLTALESEFSFDRNKLDLRSVRTLGDLTLILRDLL